MVVDARHDRTLVNLRASKIMNDTYYHPEELRRLMEFLSRGTLASSISSK